MQILLIYPKVPETFWSFKYALRFISRKAAYPPLGLLTIASFLPETWSSRLIDLNVSRLQDRDFDGVDMVFISAMIIQKESTLEILQRCRSRGIPTVAGGPLFTLDEEGEFSGLVDHLILDEAEITLPPFLADLQQGKAKRVYSSKQRPNLDGTPIPKWDLIALNHYATMPIQYSRGCPFDCEFCDITHLNGRTPRTKGNAQMLRELDALYDRGWRGGVFIVDDNFIGNKNKVKGLLPEIVCWNRERRYPFHFTTEASLNLADDDELLQLMVEANFSQVFLGLETPHQGSLVECNKVQNAERDLVASVKKIQKAGLEVMGGFIVGFDSDPPSIFDLQINFIQKIGVVTAMVGLLNAVPGSRLYQRLKDQGRILSQSLGNNTDGILNFMPKMDYRMVLDGYRRIVETIYAPKNYYERIMTFLKNYNPKTKGRRMHFRYFKAFTKSLFILGFKGKGKRYYWKLLSAALFRYRKAFPEAMTYAIYGYHFRKIFRTQQFSVPPQLSPVPVAEQDVAGPLC